MYRAPPLNAMPGRLSGDRAILSLATAEADRYASGTAQPTDRATGRLCCSAQRMAIRRHELASVLMGLLYALRRLHHWAPRGVRG
jgi:hypothetical protein